MFMGETMTKDKIRFLEEIASNGYIALNGMQYDGWILRFSNGYTGRANSISVLFGKTNEIAMNLYKKLGFKKDYSYWYMKKSTV